MALQRSARRGLSVLIAWLCAFTFAPPFPRAAIATESVASKKEPKFRSYDEAMRYVRANYRGESLDTGRSSWITSAEYFHADGRGYLILGMKGRPYIFAGVPRKVWEEFKGALSLGRYYNQNIRGRYRLELEP